MIKVQRYALEITKQTTKAGFEITKQSTKGVCTLLGNYQAKYKGWIEFMFKISKKTFEKSKVMIFFQHYTHILFVKSQILSEAIFTYKDLLVSPHIWQ